MRRALALVWALCATTPSLATDVASLVVEGGELRLPPPGVSVMAGYLRLKNDSGVPVTVTKVEVEGARSVTLHETRTVGGRTTMAPLPKLVVPPREAVALAPGGKHLMVMFAKRPDAGADVGVTFYLDDGRTSHGVLKAAESRP